MAEQKQTEMLRYWVWLTLVFGACSTKLLTYLQRYETPEDIYYAMQTGKILDLPPQAQKGMTAHPIGEADSIIYFCRSHDIYLITIDSDLYPQSLRNIDTPPVLLTAQGNLDLLQNPLALSVVGTRQPSPYTEKVTQAILSALCRDPFTIISGFAHGVDTISHQTALAAGASTIAVLGCGINVNYPRTNERLRQQMISSGNGLLLSEYLPGTQPIPANFPKRNRILSGLGYATAVMEAGRRSGSLLTAQCAVDQGRYLYCVPPADLFDARYEGVIPMLRDGAIPLMSHEDILMAYYTRYPQYLALTESGVRNSERLVYTLQDIPAAVRYVEGIGQPSLDFAADVQRAVRAQLAETAAEHQADVLPSEKPEVKPKTELPLPESEEGRQIVQFLRKHGDTYADDIAAALDMDLSLLLSELTMLEMDGFVETLFGKRYRAFDMG